MKLKTTLLAVVSSAVLLTSGAAIAQNAAVVNGKAIPKAKVDEFVAALAQQGRPDSPELRTAVRDELISRELFVQDAEKKGLTRNPDVMKQVDAARQDILVRATIREYLKGNPVKDEDVKSEYDRVAAQAGEKEYKVRHILVEKEDTAKSLIEQINKGAKFEELAKQSKDPGSAANGGDLDWARPATFVKPFAEAMVKLDKGKMTETPVQSEFGWHIIRVDDIRDSKPPAFDQVKPQIAQELERRKIQTLLKDLREKAKIQ